MLKKIWKGNVKKAGKVRYEIVRYARLYDSIFRISIHRSRNPLQKIPIPRKSNFVAFMPMNPEEEISDEERAKFNEICEVLIVIFYLSSHQSIMYR